MKDKKLSSTMRLRKLGFLLCLSLLPFMQGYEASTAQTRFAQALPTGAASTLENDPVALIQVFLESESQLRELAAIVPTFYLRLDTPQGSMHLLLPADSRQQEALLRSGFEVKVLDPDTRGETYYQLYGLPEALDRARAFYEILISEGRLGVVRTAPDQVERLEKLGLMTQALRPHPLTVPSETDLAFQKSPSLPNAVTPSPLIQGMIAQVNSNTLFTHIGNLSGEWPVMITGSPYTIFTRFTYADNPIEKATRFAYEHLEALGLPVSFHYYTYNGFELRNVIAEQSGLTQPQRIFMLVAHLDSISESPYSFAPGADDNASGSAAVMTIAEILSQYHFGCTLRYALFTAEEQGYHGSGAYAATARQLQENIEGVINLDMLAYNSSGTSPSLELHARVSNANDLAIANLFADAISAYSIGLVPTIYPDGMTFSDHASFWDYGYPAIMAIEDWEDHTPYYHTTSDQLETLNLPYYTEFAKASLATLAHMGCLLDGQLQGTVRDAATGDPLSGVAVEAKSDSGQVHQMTTQGDGVYQFILPPGSYTMTLSAIDHRTEIVGGVQVIQNQATILDRSLQPCITVKNVNFNFSPIRPMVDETITFTATIGSGETPITYSWDFWGGSSGSGQQVTHAYHAKGGYAAILTADNACVVPSTILHPVFVEAELLYLPIVLK